MKSAISPLLGYNTNIRHKGKVFHVQTEDSGIKHPHIITHLFADGGRILKTQKRSYGEHVGTETFAETVKAMMQEQHKAMLIALRDGSFDHLLDGAKPAAQRPASMPDSGEIAVSSAPLPSVPVSSAPPSAKPLSQAPASLGSAIAPVAPPPPAVPAVPGLAPRTQTLAFGSQEVARIVEAGAPESPSATPADLPPPPASVFHKSRAGAGSAPTNTYPAVAPEGLGAKPEPPPSQVDGAAGAPTAGAAPARYAPSRPAAIFAATRPSDTTSIFGEDLISEKSLDEVILSYLAEDLEAGDPSADKK